MPIFVFVSKFNCTIVIDFPFQPITTNVLFFNQSEVRANRHFNCARFSRLAPVAAFILLAVLISGKKVKKTFSAVQLAKTHKKQKKGYGTARFHFATLFTHDVVKCFFMALKNGACITTSFFVLSKYLFFCHFNARRKEVNCL